MIICSSPGIMSLERICGIANHIWGRRTIVNQQRAAVLNLSGPGLGQLRGLLRPGPRCRLRGAGTEQKRGDD